MHISVCDQFAFKALTDIEQVHGHLLAAEGQCVGQVDVVRDVVDMVESEEFMVGAFVFFQMLVVGLGD